MSTTDAQRVQAHLDTVTSRRSLLRFFAFGGVAAGLVAGADYLRSPLWDQYTTWQRADTDATTFLQTYAKQLARVHFGANLCPDYKLMAAGADPKRTVRLLKRYFGCTHVRLGMRWNTHAAQGIDAYDGWIEALLNHNIKTVLGYGVKAPFPPETHFPPAIEENLDALGAPHGSTVRADSPLGELALAYTDELLTHLDRAFGLENFDGFNPENEFDANYGKHALAIGPDLLRAQVQRLYAPHQRRRILINTAIISFPFHPASLTTVVNNALALRQEFPTLEPIVGADIYEETGSGRLTANAYVDTFAGVELRHGPRLIPTARQTLAAAGIPLEVTEFQISEWIREPRRHEPGSRIHAQYLLARIFDHLLDATPNPAQDPFVIRLWEMSAILENLLQDEQFFYRNDLYALIQGINQANQASGQRV
ncbi:MAG: hypothetical protein KF832_29380 [Caldilineaceae bacterium]|nr:hypothetical protein [Caldilineaceae bacterium]